MVEGGWLKMPPKRKFRELKTADEEKELLEKSVPNSTRYVTKWSFNIFAQWQNARLNKQALKEEAEFEVERKKIQSLRTLFPGRVVEFLMDKICGRSLQYNTLFRNNKH